MTTQPDLSILMQEIPDKANDFEGLRSIWNRIQSDLSLLVQNMFIETNAFKGFRSVWNHMLIIQPDKIHH